MMNATERNTTAVMRIPKNFIMVGGMRVSARVLCARIVARCPSVPSGPVVPCRAVRRVRCWLGCDTVASFRCVAGVTDGRDRQRENGHADRSTGFENVRKIRSDSRSVRSVYRYVRRTDKTESWPGWTSLRTYVAMTDGRTEERTDEPNVESNPSGPFRPRARAGDNETKASIYGLTV